MDNETSEIRSSAGSDPSTKPVLAVAALSHQHDATPVVQNLDLQLNAGQHTLLLGPSGSGKTTLINLICGLLTPTAGEIHVCGEPMSHVASEKRDDIRRRHIGLVPQQIRLVSALTVIQNLKLAQKLGGHSPNEAEAGRLIDNVGLTHRKDAKPRELSQGEAQRGAIARALITKPALIIADEPTAALDDANAERVARLLLDTAHENGSTLLIATHDARLKPYIPNTVELTMEDS